MDPDGRYSFPKLLNCARMAHPSQPVRALTYLSPKLPLERIGHDQGKFSNSTFPGKICLLDSSSALENALQNHVPTNHQVIVHPVFQANPLKLMAAAATLLCGGCSKVDNPPRVRLMDSKAVMGCDLSPLLPGRYRVLIDYYRGTASGSLQVHVGIITASPDSSSPNQVTEQCRKDLPKDPVYLMPTGSDPSDPSHFKEAEMGEFEVRENDNMGNQYFVITAQKSGNPLMSIKSLIFTYLGI